MEQRLQMIKMCFLKQFKFIILFGGLILLSPKFVLGQKNNLKATALTDLKYSFEYERFVNSSVSVLIGYRRNNTFYESTGRGIFLRGSKGENHGDRAILSLRFNLLPLLERNYNRKLKSRLVNKLSVRPKDKLYLASVLSFGKHEFEYFQGKFMKLSNCGMAPSRINANIRAGSIGLGLGYNWFKNYFNIDFGFNLHYNFVEGNKKGLEYFDGEFQEFPSDLNGFRPEVYFGIGYSF